ncbi:aminoglycoside phosphotransferase family protein [Pseudodesulfovibrio sp.]|uniref:aminoglycoside phosphotransferase family protein n=1 Tax=unclassified Pseudodesulfovibrio TaxID=2661612 RepID=UPI003B002681
MPRRTPYVDSDFFGMPPGTKASPLGGGRNSQVFLMDIPDRDPLVFKRYFVDTSDKRDRQGAEARALRFLAEAGVRQSPRLLALDKDRQASMLSYVRGDKIAEPTEHHMDESARFLVRLIELSASEEAAKTGFTSASEAFFSVEGVAENIRVRLARLDSVDDECPLCAELSNFRDNELRPALDRNLEACARLLEAADMRMDREIPESWRILSPSDFGLHNVLVRPDGTLAFFDYEYFGWDDPSKTLADFCLHPAMNLSGPLQRRFLEGVLPALIRIGYDPRRAAPLFPLFGLKWCCILLNEFVPRDMARRAFAIAGVEAEPQVEKEAVDQVLTRQLDKASALLHSLDDRAAVFAHHIDTLAPRP